MWRGERDVISICLIGTSFYGTAVTRESLS